MDNWIILHDVILFHPS